ncbi:MAG: TetR family transcriptional regulator [Roseovarius sp.]|nr:TetR family transcriptional regulator [Roseovarius sp.]
MPRPKSYDRQDAIAKACNVFWEHGFQDLGVRELERLTGLNQFAIRSEFGGKESLYIESLDYYCDAAITAEMAPMKHGRITEIIAFFQGLVTPGSMTSSDHGCLIVNTGIENARIQSPRLDTVVRTYWNTLEDHFLSALENEQAAQGDEATFIPHILAASLVPAVMGIHAQNRSQQDQTAGRPLVDLICSVLTEFRPS